MRKTILLLLFVPFILGIAKRDSAEPGLYPVPLETELQQHIISVCDAYQIDPALVMAIIEKESTYDARKIGDGGDSYGLMQVNAQYHGDRMEKLCISNLKCPYCNVIVGIDYLAELLEEYGDVHKALICYNAGRTNAWNGWFSVGRYQSDYSRYVVSHAEALGGQINE